MEFYFAGAAVIVSVILLLRRYFGRKYGNGDCNGCGNCPYAQKCNRKK